MIKSILFIMVAILVYAYFGYPLLLAMICKFIKYRVDKRDITPFVTLIVAAYNERAVIGQKIENILSLDYSKDKLEVIIISDASTDNTDSIVNEYKDRGIKLHRMTKRGGKIVGHQAVISKVQGEIIVFSDATGMYKPDAIKKLVANFNDQKIVCVGGILRYVNQKKSTLGKGEGLYWRYEVFLRKLESKLGKLPTVSGSIYAVRKDWYIDFPGDLADDLIIPLNALKKGYKVVYEPEAICFEETISDKKQELAKRARIANQNSRGLLYMKDILNPFKYGLTAIIVFSHKLLRLIAPILLILMFSTSLLIMNRSLVFKILFWLQIGFYFAALAGYILVLLGKKNKSLTVPYYFCTTNYGVFLGILRFISGVDELTWDPVR